MTATLSANEHIDTIGQVRPEETTRNNWGIEAVVYAGQQFHKKSSSSQLKHALGVSHAHLSDMEMREAADYLGLKSQVTTLHTQALDTLPLPALIENNHGWQVITQVSDGHWTCYDPSTQQLQTKPVSPNPSQRKHKVMLLADEQLSSKEVKFGLSWFAPSILRQKSQLR
ncbi:cysteine peptidase family C39 domain-containing protein, partial [Vibrio vulnificus]